MKHIKINKLGPGEIFEILIAGFIALAVSTLIETFWNPVLSFLNSATVFLHSFGYWPYLVIFLIPVLWGTSHYMFELVDVPDNKEKQTNEK
jgi:phosphotransferase system  glucose/maltose/N-acetylglucosamine-specific IIC component